MWANTNYCFISLTFSDQNKRRHYKTSLTPDTLTDTVYVLQSPSQNRTEQMQQQNTILIKPFQMMGRNLILHIREGAHILDKYE